LTNGAPALVHRQPSLSTKLFYGFGSVAFGVKDNGFAFFLLLYYNQVLGLPERLVGFAIMTALILDAFCDPIIGYVSDHFRSRWGRRHPFMYFSALPVAASYVLLWNPPEGLSQNGLLIYLVAVSILVRTMITFYEIPSSSLVAELTDDYDDRTTILSYRYFFGWWGGLAMSILAYSFFLQPDAEYATGVLNPDGYRAYGTASSIVMAIAILTSALGTHSYIPYLRQPSERPHGFVATYRELLATFSNRSFIALFCAAIFLAMAAGLMASLSIYFNTYFWELSSTEISILVMGNFISAVIAVAVAPRLSRHYGKRSGAVRTALMLLVIGPIPVVLRLLGWFPENGSPALVPILFVANLAAVALIIVFGVMMSSMVADVVEDSEMTTGRRSEGTFFAANSFVQKAVSGIGVFLSTLLLNVIGFPRDAQPGAVDPEVVRTLGIVYVPFLGVVVVIVIAFLSMYRINRAGHETNLRKLAERRAASSTAP
jgi:Na+/melibiose symporter-like transporter